MVASIKNSVAYITFRHYNKTLRRYVKLPRYLGNTYACSVCGVHLRAFKPIWKSYGRNLERFGFIHRHDKMETLNLEAYSCPKCDATDRDRLMAIHLDLVWPSFDAKRPIRLVEFAPSRPLSVKLKRYPSVDYRSADLFRNEVQDRIDLTDIRYPGASIDIFICSHILEHIPDDRKAMRELCRTLKPDGFGMILVPLVIGLEETSEAQGETTEEYRWKHFGMGDHLRLYSKRDFVDRLVKSGFAVEQLGVDHFGQETFRRHGIAENSILYVVRPGQRTREA